MSNINRVQLIKDNYNNIIEKVNKNASLAGRDPHDICVIVVTKGHSIEVIDSAFEAGIYQFGENYYEEALEKITHFDESLGIEWHMIGHIQSRKARNVGKYFHFIDSLDSVKLAIRLDRFAKDINKIIPVLLECNTSGEMSKYGFPAWDEQQFEIFASQVKEINGLSQLRICGLMTMAPLFSDPNQTRKYFKRLYNLRDQLRYLYPYIALEELSMGMSSDFEIAIQEGATQVRIGQAILGPR